MNGNWSKKWKQVLIWLSGYVSFIAFALLGGYAIVKSEDEDLKKTAKQTFIVMLIFTAFSALFALLNYVGGFMDNYYSSTLYDVYSILTRILSIAQIITYAIFVIMTLAKKEEN